MITLMNENVLSAGDKNETWTAYKGWKDKQPSRQVIKNIEDAKRNQGCDGYVKLTLWLCLSRIYPHALYPGLFFGH